MPWDPLKPAGTDAANTIDNSVQPNFSALDTWASALTDGISTGAATVIQVLRAANATIARFRSAAADTNDRFRWDLNGRLEWGPGNAAPDILLERVAANLLATSNGDAIAHALHRLETAAEVTNTVAETDLYTFNVPANTMGTNRTLRLTLVGDVLSNSGSGVNLTLRFKFGGTLVGSFVVNFASTVDRYAHRCEFEIYESDSTVLQRGLARWIIYGAGSADNLGGTQPLIGNGDRGGFRNNLAVDTTLAQSLTITAEWATASTNLSVRALSRRLEVI